MGGDSPSVGRSVHLPCHLPILSFSRFRPTPPAAVNLTAAEKAGAYYLKGASAGATPAAPAPAPAGAQQPASVLLPVADAGALQEGAPSAEAAGDLLESAPSPAAAPGPKEAAGAAQAAPAPRPFLRD